VTSRASSFQPELGMRTTIVWSPMGSETLIGVTFPVKIPST
jgi:hypothetical protein